jgi:hypothetical protein
MNPFSTSLAQAHIHDMQKAACRYQLRKLARARRTK